MGAGAEVSFIGAGAGAEMGALEARALEAAGLVAFGAGFTGLLGASGLIFAGVIFASLMTSGLASAVRSIWSLGMLGACGAVATSAAGDVSAVTTASVWGVGLPQDTIRVRIERRNK